MQAHPADTGALINGAQAVCGQLRSWSQEAQEVCLADQVLTTTQSSAICLSVDCERGTCERTFACVESEIAESFILPFIVSAPKHFTGQSTSSAAGSSLANALKMALEAPVELFNGLKW